MTKEQSRSFMGLITIERNLATNCRQLYQAERIGKQNKDYLCKTCHKIEHSM